MPPKAKSPRNTDRKDFSPDEILAAFREDFPGVDLDEILSDPTGKETTRRLDAALVKWGIIQMAVRATRSRAGELVPYFTDKLFSLVELDAKLSGVFGERIIEVPQDPVSRLCMMMGIVDADNQVGEPERQKFFALVGDLPQLTGKKEEKVVHARVRRSRKKSD